MKSIYYFYKCYHCGSWFYSKGRIKQKKCFFCNKTFQFTKSTKFSKTCSPQEAIAILKKLKEKEMDKDISKFKNVNYL